MLNKINSFSIYDCRLCDCQLPDAIVFVLLAIRIYILFYREKITLRIYMDNVPLSSHTNSMRTVWGRKTHTHNRLYWYVTVLQAAQRTIEHLNLSAHFVRICIFVTTLQLLSSWTPSMSVRGDAWCSLAAQTKWKKNATTRILFRLMSIYLS